jgi:hypothetical protein
VAVLMELSFLPAGRPSATCRCTLPRSDVGRRRVGWTVTEERTEERRRRPRSRPEKPAERSGAAQLGARRGARRVTHREPAPVLETRSMRSRLARVASRRPARATRCWTRCSALVRANHPKADLALLGAATTPPQRCTAPRCARAVTPTSPTRLAVTTILADIGMTEPTLVAALLHDTGRGHAVHPRAGPAGLRRGGRPARRRRHQARQGQVRRLRRRPRPSAR